MKTLQNEKGLVMILQIQEVARQIAKNNKKDFEITILRLGSLSKNVELIYKIEIASKLAVLCLLLMNYEKDCQACNQEDIFLLGKALIKQDFDNPKVNKKLNKQLNGAFIFCKNIIENNSYNFNACLLESIKDLQSHYLANFMMCQSFLTKDIALEQFTELINK